ncbi:hypothetical protein [Mesorhizobium sp.]|uniref:hypothetical protein n=1 Tax=Mesorhizobium sp. TaxID=1871066 RepID=UPI000FE3F1A8|nr:hypothetical protein [Mesorhizobium sp.]RWG77824.1 MAG: hypothetical protein EOQ69_28190 [Mesorhizobium sp.]RWG79144.1 MAG: hypothetical protein EOQ70_29515 [Mesorhizobium sp.]RWK00045.1 MAG: hypothetical protein EOR42_24410 [Mesorhizobium sp.]RWK05764.1 MAG: hypothetical protein EOR39_25870 [Mesorhizobium sp.]RWK14766.1 MAG: hypothetical protein EOR41_26460 [Mesorhizobium sp.]
MTRDEFEQNRRRFGDDVGAWPAPLRQEALEFLALAGDADPGDAPDVALDRLVREAALVEGDDHALARSVLARIDTERRSLFPRCLLAPAGVAACAAAVLVAATLAGYQVARMQDELQETDLLALASGARLSEGGGPGIAVEPAAEDSL